MLPVTNAGTSTDCPVKKKVADEARGMLSHSRMFQEVRING